MSTYTIEQFITDTRNWEAVPEGDFDTREEAEAALNDLEENLGWTNLRATQTDDHEYEVVKTVGAFEVIRIPERRVPMKLLRPGPDDWKAVPAKLSVRRRGAGDDEPRSVDFATLQEAIDYARQQDWERRHPVTD